MSGELYVCMEGLRGETEDNYSNDMESKSPNTTNSTKLKVNLTQPASRSFRQKPSEIALSMRSTNTGRVRLNT